MRIWHSEEGHRWDQIKLNLRTYCAWSYCGDGVQLDSPLLQEDLDQAQPTRLCGNGTKLEEDSDKVEVQLACITKHSSLHSISVNSTVRSNVKIVMIFKSAWERALTIWSGSNSDGHNDHVQGVIMSIFFCTETNSACINSSRHERLLWHKCDRSRAQNVLMPCS